MVKYVAMLIAVVGMLFFVVRIIALHDPIEGSIERH